MERLEQLKHFMKEEPEDEFLHYALALEYLKFDFGKAKNEFENLLRKHPDYLPTYYPAAHLMIELGDENEAEKLFTKGMEIAKSQGDQKMLMELRAAHDGWQLERK